MVEGTSWKLPVDEKGKQHGRVGRAVVGCGATTLVQIGCGEGRQSAGAQLRLPVGELWICVLYSASPKPPSVLLLPLLLLLILRTACDTRSPQHNRCWRSPTMQPAHRVAAVHTLLRCAPSSPLRACT